MAESIRQAKADRNAANGERGKHPNAKSTDKPNEKPKWPKSSRTGTGPPPNSPTPAADESPQDKYEKFNKLIKQLQDMEEGQVTGIEQLRFEPAPPPPAPTKSATQIETEANEAWNEAMGKSAKMRSKHRKTCNNVEHLQKQLEQARITEAEYKANYAAAQAESNTKLAALTAALAAADAEGQQKQGTAKPEADGPTRTAFSERCRRARRWSQAMESEEDEEMGEKTTSTHGKPTPSPEAAEVWRRLRGMVDEAAANPVSEEAAETRQSQVEAAAATLMELVRTKRKRDDDDHTTEPIPKVPSVAPVATAAAETPTHGVAAHGDRSRSASLTDAAAEGRGQQQGDVHIASAFTLRASHAGAARPRKSWLSTKPMPSSQPNRIGSSWTRPSTWDTSLATVGK